MSHTPDHKSLSANPLALGGLGMSSASSSAKVAPSSSEALTSGTLDGTEWSSSAAKAALYELAKDQGLEVLKRHSKAEIIEALSAATNAQG